MVRGSFNTKPEYFKLKKYFLLGVIGLSVALFVYQLFQTENLINEAIIKKKNYYTEQNFVS